MMGRVWDERGWTLAGPFKSSPGNSGGTILAAARGTISIIDDRASTTQNDAPPFIQNARLNSAEAGDAICDPT